MEKLLKEEITFKETKDLDYEKVVDIFFEVGFLRFPEKRRIYKQAIETAFRNSQYVLSAYKGDELIGFVRILTDKSLFATVWNMMIKYKYQFQGIGTQMLQKCLDRYPKLHFFLIGDNNVSGFYEKLGFKRHHFGMQLDKGRKACVIYN